MKRLQMLVMAAVASLSATMAMAEESSGFGLHSSVAGKPIPGGINFQRPVTPIMDSVIWLETFMNVIMFGIMALVVILLAIVVLRFNRKANPTPSKVAHNTPLEIAWTAVPVILLIIIAIPSLKLLYEQLHIPQADVTIKATGHQWYWSYEYPDEKISFASVLLEKDELKENGYTPDEYLLATDTRVIVPVNKVVHVLVTASDVIHSWTVPSFGSKIDAMPGRLNETWFKATETGTFFGQCSELCGLRHAYMPIVVEVVEQAEYDAWVAKQQAMNGASEPATRVATAE